MHSRALPTRLFSPQSGLRTIPGRAHPLCLRPLRRGGNRPLGRGEAVSRLCSLRGSVDWQAPWHRAADAGMTARSAGRGRLPDPLTSVAGTGTIRRDAPLCQHCTKEACVPRPPNILIFMTDQEQAAVVHPDHPCLTPNASRLASQGVLFRNAYCPTAHCCPSRATFMTGLYPSRHGIYNNVSNPTAIHRALYPGVRMFSEALREAGYNLAYAGKWHVSNEENPSDRGWEELVIIAGKGGYMHRSLEQWRRLAGEPEPHGP
ncbi:MAG: hypothetical protein C4289_01480, partial [Chloroflexota bacterium]